MNVTDFRAYSAQTALVFGLAAGALCLQPGMAHAQPHPDSPPPMQSQVFPVQSQALPIQPQATPVLPAAEAQKGAEEAVEILPDVYIMGTAAEAWKQAPGVSVISSGQVMEMPGNDLADIVRKQPGVNLTGNSSSGQRGNNRQIDIRGMGPENTMILIDGRPVRSRDSVRYGWRGERDSHGDMNWVPADAIEQIEVLRGPAAARYGSGSAGGVVNIITKSVPSQLGGTASVYVETPESSVDGNRRHVDFSLAGPVSERAGFRLSGNIAKTGADAWDINRDHASTRRGPFARTFAAGREGLRNRDIAARLSLVPDAANTIDLDMSYGRQGNIYAGDTQNTNNFTVDANGNLVPTSQRVMDALGRETNRIYRSAYAVTHKGSYNFGSSLSYVQYEETRNSRIQEGLAGGSEGLFSSGQFETAHLKNWTLHSEMSLPGRWGRVGQVTTLGVEWVEQRLDDPNSMQQDGNEGGLVRGLPSTGRNSSISARIGSVFAEQNIELGSATIVTPGVRLDHHSEVGTNWSPSLNLSQGLANNITVKAGVARAYKAPNLYQLNPNYLLYSRGIGCWGGHGSCYLQGNRDLKAENSINTELGIEYAGERLLAGATYFHNNYRNKIEAGREVRGNASGGRGEHANAQLFEWENVPRAVIAGIEGTLEADIARTLNWSNNFTYMMKSRNESTGQQLSIIPRYTVNTRLNWQADSRFSLYADATFYGRQKPNYLDYQGLVLQGEEVQEVGSYAIAGLGTRYSPGGGLSFSAGVKNLFDKRLYRKGNAVGAGVPRTIYGAGAATYNEPGRSYFIAATAQF